MHESTWDQHELTVGQVAARSGVAVSALHFYEREGLIDPARSPGGTRRYSRNDITRLHEICTLTGDGLNMAGIRRVLELQEETRQLQAELARLKRVSQRQTPG